MASLSLLCPKCHRSLKIAPEWNACPGCESMLNIEVFPALFRTAAPGQTGDALLMEGESSCFYHAGKKAVLPCQACGRFLCALCDCELNGQHFCPNCLEVGRKKGKIKNLEDKRTLYDSIALSLAILPLLTLVFWFFSIITAPMALFVAIRYWNAPLSIVRRSRLRFVIALVAASAVMLGWISIIYFAMTANSV